MIENMKKKISRHYESSYDGINKISNRLINLLLQIIINVFGSRNIELETYLKQSNFKKSNYKILHPVLNEKTWRNKSFWISSLDA